MSEKKKLKVALMNCSHSHARGYYWFIGSALFDVVACSVPPEYRDRVFIENLKGLDMFEDDEEMLDAHPEIEAVVMASPNYLHKKEFEMCFRRGIAVLSMKVPTLQLDEYKEILALQEKYNGKCFIELEMRSSAELLRLKELVQSGKIGKVTSFCGWNLSHNPVWWLKWHGIPEEIYGKRVPIEENSSICRGGALTDHPHIFDAIQYVLDDEIEEIYAETAPNMRPTEVEDFVFLIGKTQKGTVFSLDPSYSRTENPADLIGPGWEQYPKRVEVNISVFGEKGYIMGDVYGHWIHHTGKPNHNYTSVRCSGRCDPRVKVSEAFYDYVTKGTKPPVTLREHYKTMCIIDAAYRSIYEKRPVKVNFSL